MSQAPLPDPAATNWHLDKRVNVALLVAILLQAAGAAWWASSLSARVAFLELANTRATSFESRLVRLEEHVAISNQYLQRIDQRLERIEDRR